MAAKILKRSIKKMSMAIIMPCGSTQNVIHILLLARPAVAILLMIMVSIGFLLIHPRWGSTMLSLWIMTNRTTSMAAYRIMLFGMVHQTIRTTRIGKAAVIILLNLWWVVMECRCS